MKNIEALKNEIKEKAGTIRGLRMQINELKWKPEAREQVAALKKKRPKVGKSALKPFRRPETSPVRRALWDEKREGGRQARHLLLAYAALRGRPYARVEVTCDENNKPNAYTLAALIKARVEPALAALWTVSAIEAWLKGTPLPVPDRPEEMGATA